MKKLIALTLLLSPYVFSIGQSNSGKVDKRFKGIDRKLEKVMEAWDGAGFAVAVVDKNQIVYSSGFGYKNFEAKEEVTTETLFPIGSCTKAFTAALIGQLQDEEKVDLDDSPRDYLPKLHFYNSDMDRMITIRDMMCHRTGLPRHDFSWYFFPTDSRQELLERIEHQEPVSGIREDWIYNNFMYLALGAISEEITGKSWDNNISERFFAPLEMHQSNTLMSVLKTSNDKSFGYGSSRSGEVELEEYYDIKAMSPAGAINSNVEEMSRWLIAWLNKGKYEGKEIFSEAYYQEAITPQMAIGGTPSEKYPDLHSSSYGLGWFLTSYRGHYRVEHGGNINGFSANMSFFPTDSLGIVVLTNENGSSIPATVRNTIADHVLGLEEIDWIADQLGSGSNEDEEEGGDEESEEDLARITGTNTSHELEEYAGTFNHPGYGSFEVSVNNDSLFAETPNMQVWLKHYHYDVFEPYKVVKGKIQEESFPGPKFNFQTSDQGEINSISMPLQMGIDPLEFKRTVQEVEMQSEELMMYVGEYELEGMVCKVLLNEENEMTLTVPGQPKYTLIAVGGDKFILKDIDGYSLQFVKADDKHIKAVQFIQPNGTFEAKRK